MSGSDEVSEGGVPVFRHAAKDDADDSTAEIDAAAVEKIEAHLDEFVGAAVTVYHEIISPHVHLDVHIVPPGDDRDYWTLFTTGMSDLPMKPPPGAEDMAYAELILCLPKDWPLGLDENGVGRIPDEHFWPIAWLKSLARLPHAFDSWLSAFHTIPSGDPPEPFAPDTKLCCWCLFPPYAVADGFSPLPIRPAGDVRPGKTIHFWQIVALYEGEMNLKLKRGTEAMLNALRASPVTAEQLYILNPNRPEFRPPATGLRKFFGRR